MGGDRNCGGAHDKLIPESVYAGHPEMHLIVAYVRKRIRKRFQSPVSQKIGGISVVSQERLFESFWANSINVCIGRLNAARVDAPGNSELA